MDPNTLKIDQLNTAFKSISPQEILAWSWETFQSSSAVSTSFQTQSVALLHMISQVCPEIHIVFTDTGFHFPETLAFRDELISKFDLRNVHTIYPDTNIQSVSQNSSLPLHLHDPDSCCKTHKIVPMENALKGKEAWVVGLRRDQTQYRRDIQIVELQPNDLIKIHPLANWTERDLWKYMDHHNLPMHPLFSKGYISIGCAPCTVPVSVGESHRSGRWAHSDKLECGLHTNAIRPEKASS